MGSRSRGIYNKIYTPELWSQVNPINIEILDDFISEYKQRKKAKGTIEQYYSDIRSVLIIILQDYQNKSILELTKKDFRNISLKLSEDMDLSSARVNRMKSAINSMLTFVEEDEEDYKNYNINLAKKVRGLPKKSVKTDEDNFYFTFDEFIEIRKRLIAQGDLQTAAMLSIAFDSGGRKNEIFQIQKQGILDGNKTNVVVGKRGKTFNLFYLDDTKEIIRKYLEKRGEDDIPDLWIQSSGDKKQPIKYETLYARILKCSKILSEIRGVETSIFFHSIRHSIAESMAQGTNDRLKNPDGTNRKFTLEEIAVLLHHENVSTTQLYTKNHDEDLILDMFGLNKEKLGEKDAIKS